MYKVINPQGKILDYTDGHRGWGHNIEMIRDIEVVSYDGFDAQAYTACIFSQQKPRVGDFILLSMKSGKIGAFEIVKVSGFRDPSDMFSINFVACGSWYSEGKELIIWDGYGIKPKKENLFSLGNMKKFISGK